MNLTVSLLFINDATCREVEKALSRVDGVNIVECSVSDDRPLRKIGKKELPDVLIVEINGHREQDMVDLERVIEGYGERLTVFVTYREGDLDVMRRLMRAGVKDAFPQPLQIQELVLEITGVISAKRERLRQARSRKGAVTAFLNAKGGSGATTIAVNVAYELAANHEAKTLLIDLDIQFGIAALCLDIKGESTVMDALDAPRRLDPVFLQALVTKHSSGLDVLMSPGKLGSIEEVGADAVQRLIETAVEDYDFVVVDLPRVFLPWMVTALKLADPVMLVVQNTLATIRDCRLILDRLPALGVPLANLELVNNRAMADVASVSIDELKQVLSHERIHRVRNDYSAAVVAQDEGKPVSEASKRSVLAKDLGHLAEYLAQVHGGIGEEKHTVWDRLFGRRN
jgi:pilus assembly protein CpaE